MNNNIQNSIKNKAKELLPRIIEIRRHFHENPELSFQEVNTNKFIISILEELNISYSSGWAGFGIVAKLEGKDNTKTIMLRADMDALPIVETNQVDYISKNIGIMHACGHDVHMSSVIGTLMILNELKNELPCNVHFIFQPGEEKLPGGASMMIKEGVLKDPKPAYILGQHVFPSLDVGKVGIRSGLYMASADEIYLEVKGKGGHAAMPQDNNDVVLAAAQIIVSLQQIVSRNANPSIPSVLSFGKFNTVGGATNVIPDIVKIEGTFRTMDEVWRTKAHQQLKHISETIAASYGVECKVNIEVGYPCLINDVALSEKIKTKMIEFLGSENVVDLPIRMTSEDFAFYSQVVPACFYRLGTRNESKNITSSVHTSTFDIDEKALEVGMGLMAWMVLTDL